MLRVGIIEDDIEHLVGVLRSLVALKQHRGDFDIVPVLLSDPEIDTPQAIEDWAEEEKEPLKHAGIDVSNWPKIEQKGKLCPIDPNHCDEILKYLAIQDVHVIICDSWMGQSSETRFSQSDLKLAGVRLLDEAEKDERWKGKCWLMTKFGNDVLQELVMTARWRPKVFNPLNFEDWRYIDKSKVHDVVPGEWEIQLERVVEEGIARMRLAEPIKLSSEEILNGKFGDMVGTSKVMLDVYETILKVAETDSSVLILGEIGTGKELIACEIHRRSPRSNKPMVDVNCGNIQDDLVSSELFGYEPGAFTGATKQKKGLFEVADKSTIFLDEIGEMPIETQKALLRVIQQRVIRRVGGTKNIPVDVRIIAATNKDLRELIELNKFREDLYSRLEVITIIVPPLRHRREDICRLVDHFIGKFNKVYETRGKHVENCSKRALEILEAYHWPQNVRELEHRIEEAFVFLQNKRTLDEDNPAIKKIEQQLVKKISVVPPQQTTEKEAPSNNLKSSGRYQSPAEAWEAIENEKDKRTLDEWDIELGTPETFDVIELIKQKRFGRYPNPDEVMRLFGMTYGAWKGWIFRNKKKIEKRN